MTKAIKVTKKQIERLTSISRIGSFSIEYQYQVNFNNVQFEAKSNRDLYWLDRNTMDSGIYGTIKTKKEFISNVCEFLNR